MVGMVRKLTKTVVLSVGAIMLSAVCAAGATGIYFKEDAVKFYSELRTEVLSISQTLESGIEQFNKTIEKVGTLPEQLKTEFDQHKQSFEEIAKKLEQQADQIGQQPPSGSGGQTSSEQLKQLAQQIRTASNSISTGIDNITGEVGSIVNNGVVEEIKTFLNTVKTDYLPKVNKITTDITPEKFSEYYGFTATIMVGVSGSILGLGLLSSLLTCSLYKNVDGKLVRKSKQKSELTDHVKHILKKYPEIKEKIVDEF